MLPCTYVHAFVYANIYFMIHYFNLSVFIRQEQEKVDHKKKKKSQNEPMHTGPRTVRRAGQPDGRCSVPGHPGVRGQS